MIRGPGSGTSDSILAWLSNGEGVLTARALRHYGSGIVNRINSLQMPRFARGGKVGGDGIPRFADGGTVITLSVNTPPGRPGEIEFDAEKIIDGFVKSYNSNVQPVMDRLLELPDKFVEGIVKAMSGFANAIMQSAKVVPNEKKEVGFLGNVREFAGGGVLRGPGTGQSDSILSWLSNGEGVLTARALSHYGSGIVDRINSLQMPRFSVGGVLNLINSSMAMPQAFAAGGIPSAGGDSGGGDASGRRVTFVIDGKQFGGFSAPDGVVDSLEEHAVRSQYLSTGPAPRWRGSR